MSDAFAFIQSNRLLKLTAAPGFGLAENALLPYELAGEETISAGFTYTLVCLTDDAFLDVGQLVGVPIQLAILTDDGSERALCGFVTAARQEGGNGGFSRIVLTLQDPMAVLAKRTNSRVFQDLSVLDMVTLIVREHLQANRGMMQCVDIVNQCRGSHPQQALAIQYNETDSQFCGRWLAQEGVSWYIAHGEESVPGEHPKMTIVLFDQETVLPIAPAAKVRFHRADGTESEDTITQWHHSRLLQPGRTMRASYEYKAVVVNTQQDENPADQGDAGNGLAASLEDYGFDTHHAANDGDDYARYGKLRAHAHAQAVELFSAAGTQRELPVCHYFELRNHPVHDHEDMEQRQFVVIRQRLYARNNLPEDVREAAKDLLIPQDGDVSTTAPTTASGEAVFHTRFDAVRKSTPIVPAFSGTAYAKPTAPTLLTAVVVGPADEEIHVNEFNCVKIRFGFTRAQDHAHAEGAGASDSDRDSIWVRVSQPWTGSRYGHTWVPRINDEVVVQFVAGDIDRPLITQTVNNGTHLPATFSHAGSQPGNKMLSGIKSKMVKGEGYNELIFDDTTDELRTKLSSEHAKTQLNQGYLIHPRADGKGEPRGEGFELRTDAAGAIRAAKGLLISTDGRLNASGKQLSREELSDCLHAARELAQTLADLAEKQNADKTDYTPQEHLKQAVDAWEKGTNTDPQGTSAQSESAGQQPIIAMGSPAGIVLSTPQSMTQYTGKNLDLVSQQDTNQTTGKRWIANVAESISLFTAGVADKLKQTGKGIAFKLIAAKGKILIQAQSDELEQEAEKNIRLKSNASIKINSRGDTTIVESGGASIELSGGNVTIKCPGNFVVHAADHSFAGPASGTPELPTMPKNEFKNDHDWSISG